MSDLEMRGYYETSYPPSLWAGSTATPVGTTTTPVGPTTTTTMTPTARTALRVGDTFKTATTTTLAELLAQLNAEHDADPPAAWPPGDVIHIDPNGPDRPATHAIWDGATWKNTREQFHPNHFAANIYQAHVSDPAAIQWFLDNTEGDPVTPWPIWDTNIGPQIIRVGTAAIPYRWDGTHWVLLPTPTKVTAHTFGYEFDPLGSMVNNHADLVALGALGQTKAWDTTSASHGAIETADGAFHHWDGTVWQRVHWVPTPGAADPTVRGQWVQGP